MSRAQKKPALDAVEAPTVTIADIAAEARRLQEQAAIIESAAEEVLRLFHGEPPRRLLQRQGEGARAATVAALVEVGVELASMTEAYRARARALLERVVERPDGPPIVASGVGLGEDEAIDAIYTKNADG